VPYDYVNGQTSVVIRVKLLNSSLTTGAGLTGLLYSSTGLVVSTIADNEATATAYTVAGSTIETIATLGTFAAPTATKCRFKEVDSTNHPGLCEIQIADARFAVSGAKSIVITLSGATNLAQRDVVIPLRAVNPYSATAFMASVATVTNLTNAPTAGDLTATMKTSIGTAVAASAVASVAAGVTLAASQHVIVDSGTVTTLTTLPTAPTDWLTAAAVKADAVTKIQSGLSTYSGGAVTLAASQHVIVDSGTVTTLSNLPTAPTDWLTAAAVQADAVTKIQSGLSTYNVASDHVLLSVGTGAGQVNASGGKVPATLAAADCSGDLPANLVTIATQTVTCAAGVTVLASVGTTSTSTAQTGDSYSRIGAAGAGLTGIPGVSDPWAIALPGSYSSGTAGAILGGVGPSIETVAAVSGDVITLQAGTALSALPTPPAVVLLLIVAGPGTGSQLEVTAYDSGTRHATIGGGFPGTAPTTASTYMLDFWQDQGLMLAASQPHYSPAKVADLGVVQTGDNFALLSPFGGTYLPATVTAVISTTVFTVRFAGGAPTPADVAGAECIFTSADLAPAKVTINSAITAGSGSLTLALSIAAPALPTTSTTVLIG
jgi:hypothetical protein